ncbi:N-acetyltransferase [Stutzerimonas kunmingensis]|uniref:N-acetyltransferase n=1 Tax=Stutzerimonas kunmingensis TaxID=1211807 RepID=UPI00241D5351|nr:N-acetyltransferase [Stutzerimonas kunmingensis]
MIRPFRPDDLEPVLAIWLAASIRAHDFIAPAFWASKLDDMRDIYLPAAQIWVDEREGEVLGFVALVGDVVAAIFVAPSAQGGGIGSALIEQAKTVCERLELTVYSANAASIAFYRRHGFAAISEQPDPHTGHPELAMAWQRG